MDLEAYSKYIYQKELGRNKQLNQLTRIQSEVSVQNKLLEPLKQPNLNTHIFKSTAKPSATPLISKNNKLLDSNLSYRKKQIDLTPLPALSNREIHRSKDLPVIHRENSDAFTSLKTHRPSAVSRSLVPIMPNKSLDDLRTGKKLKSNRLGEIRTQRVTKASPRLNPESIEKEMVSSSVFIPT